jgi:putative transposase
VRQPSGALSANAQFTLSSSAFAQHHFFMPEPKTPWPHAPTHQLSERDTYFVTAATYGKAHHFRGAARLRVLHRGLLTVAGQFGWQLEAWAVFSNHYHFVAHSPGAEPDAASLTPMLKLLHVKTSGWVNKLDGTPQRQVWFNFRDTKLGQQRSYLARLNYVNQNAVKHGLVPVACQYPWCSAAWFERTDSSAMVKSIYRFKTDRLAVENEFEPDGDWRAQARAPEDWRTPGRWRE